MRRGKLTFDILHGLIINLQQAVLPYSLVSNYAKAEKGCKSFGIAGCADHRQITDTFLITFSG